METNNITPQEENQPITPEATISPESEPETPKKKNFLKIILGVVGAVLVIIVLFFVFVIKSNSYLSHTLSKDAGDPFYKKTQILAGGDTYINDKYGISIWVPDLYVIKDNISTDDKIYIPVAFFVSSKPLKSIDIAKGIDIHLDGMRIGYFDFTQDVEFPTLEKVIETKKSEYSKKPEMSYVESGDISLGNTEGKYLIYKVEDNFYAGGGDEEVSRIIKEVFTIKNETLFHLSFTDAEDEFAVTEKLADKMFQSFKIEGSEMVGKIEQNEKKTNVELAIIKNEEGLLLLSGSEYKEAEEKFNEALKLNPELPQAHNSLGVVHSLGYRDYYTAIDYFTNAIELKSVYPKALVNRAVAYINTEQDGSAIDDLEEAIRLDPNRIDSRELLGDLYMEKLRSKDAHIQFSKAIELGSTREKTINNHAYLERQGFGE
ncbi:MAG: tetratricopeptide (TPR) repeat protein [Ulvibacter sp.]|jgi:tetratricopeptide (TPR) repeat protein